MAGSFSLQALIQYALTCTFLCFACTTTTAAQNVLFTIEVVDEDEAPLPGVTMYGNHNVAELPGLFTDGSGQLEIDLREIDKNGSTQSVQIIPLLPGYAFDPPELEISTQACPDSICSFTAHTTTAQQAIVQISIVDPLGAGIANMPLMVTDSHVPCGKQTDGFGNVYFATTRKQGQCNDNDGDDGNNINKILARSPEGYTCSFAGLTGGLCATKSYQFVRGSVQCSETSNPGLITGYTLHAKDWLDRAVVNLDFKILPQSPEHAPFTVKTDGNGRVFLPFSSVGGSANAAFRVIPEGYYTFFPAMINASMQTCPNGNCHFKLAASNQPQNIGTVHIADSNGNPKSGTAISISGSKQCLPNSVFYTDENGYAFFPVQRQSSCVDPTAWQSFLPNMPECAFSHDADNPFQFCHEQTTQLAVTAYCSPPNSVSTQAISGYVLKDGIPYPQVPILLDGELRATSRSDGSYTAYVPSGSSSKLTAELQPFIFDPQSVEFQSLFSDEKMNFAIVASTGDSPDDPEYCPVADSFLIQGRVLDRNGNPVAGAVILNNHSQMTTSDPNGQYSFLAAAHSDVWVTAEFNDEYFDPAAVSFPFVDCNQQEVNFQLTDVGSYLLGGSIIDDQARSIPEFEIRLTENGEPGYLYADADGVYRAMVLEGTDYQIIPIDSRYVCTPSQFSGQAHSDQDNLNFSCQTDECTEDPDKVTPGICGCGTADTDSDNDTTPDCVDECLSDPEKVIPGVCGCGFADTDTDGDGSADCIDNCEADENKTDPGVCGCNVTESLQDSDSDGTADCVDECSLDPEKIEPGECGCGVADIDTDNDGAYDCLDECSSDPEKILPGDCGCGIPDTDSDDDGTANCEDDCPEDANKITPGECGCGVADTDTDDDGTPDCMDLCPEDPAKIEAGICGCGQVDSETDSDNDGTLDCYDGCPFSSEKTTPGVCGCGISDVDSDNDGAPDCIDFCPNDPDKISEDDIGQCGCGVAETDSDDDGTADCEDLCPSDPEKTEPMECGCGVADSDSDSDNTLDCLDLCVEDPLKIEPGACGCGISDIDSDDDGTPDCNDACPYDSNKTSDVDSDSDGTLDCNDPCAEDAQKIDPGVCGCGTLDTDSDGDETADCQDACPADAAKIAPGQCGCGIADTDQDNDGIPSCFDSCDSDGTKTEPGVCGCNTPDDDSDADGTLDCLDQCPNDPDKVAAGACGCGIADIDSDNDGTADCHDSCAADPSKIVPGDCGCGNTDVDSDNDGSADCIDECASDPLKTVAGICGCGNTETDSDGDTVPDCTDSCPASALKTTPGVCGCTLPDIDTDADGTFNCHDLCVQDPLKISPGICGCGNSDIDSDSDGTPDCQDQCPLNPMKTAAGVCGCDSADVDKNFNGLVDCQEQLLDIVDICVAAEDEEHQSVTLCHFAQDGSDHSDTLQVDIAHAALHLGHGDYPGDCVASSSLAQSTLDNTATTKKEKITICHYPPGNPANAHSIEISATAWPAHQAHDDTQGPCDFEEICTHEKDCDDGDDDKDDDGKKVTICHFANDGSDPQSIEISESAWKAHKQHGDTTGACPDPGNEDELIQICHYPPGQPENAHSVTIKSSAWPHHESHGDTLGNCPGDSPAAVLRWKLHNPNAANYYGLLKLLTPGEPDYQDIAFTKNETKYVSTPKQPGQNILSLIIDGVIHDTEIHGLKRCEDEPSPLLLSEMCAEPTNTDSLRWKLRNTTKRKVTVVVQMSGAQPQELQSFTLPVGSEQIITTARIAGSNTLTAYVDGVAWDTKTHSLGYCATPTPTPTPSATPDEFVTIGGAIKGRNGRPLSKRLLKLLQKNRVIIEIRNRTDRRKMNVFLSAPSYTWRYRVPRGNKYRIRLKRGKWLTTSRPPSYRKSIRGSSDGYHFALRSRDLSVRTRRRR